MKTAALQALYMYGIAFVISMGVALLITCLFKLLQRLNRTKES
jgi:hypothetical protein